MSIRTALIQRLIHINEAIFFYPKLKRFYRRKLGGGSIRVIDVGANKGQSIRFFSSVGDATIDAFEPNRKLFARLQQAFGANPKIKLHNKGVSNIEGRLEFNENVLDETSTFEPLNPNSEYLQKKARVLGVSTDAIIVDRYEVDVTTLSQFLQNHREESVDVLKIDVEGHEYKVLQGLFTSSDKLPIRLIQIESHNDDMYLDAERHEDIEKLLGENGYVRAIEIKHGFGDFAEIIYEQK